MKVHKIKPCLWLQSATNGRWCFEHLHFERSSAAERRVPTLAPRVAFDRFQSERTRERGRQVHHSGWNSGSSFFIIFKKKGRKCFFPHPTIIDIVTKIKKKPEFGFFDKPL